MRKLVLGILALVSVQFAFVTYMMVLQSPMELANDLAPTQIVPRSRDLVRIAHLNNSVEEVTEPGATVSRIEPQHTEARQPAENAPERAAAKVVSRSTTRITKPAFSPAPVATAPSADFESVVIRYNRNASIPDCESRDIPKTNKRSYIAKAAPVIKKPWDWLKAIGSKLN